MTRTIAQLPHPRGRVPVLGDITSADRRRPTQHEAALARELGPIYQRKLLGDVLIVVGGAGPAGQTLNEKNWGRVLVGPLAKLRAVAGSGLFTARSSDPLWGQARRILNPGFGADAMRTYHEAMRTVVDDLAEKWSATNEVAVDSDMTAATLEVIGRAGFSRRMGLLGPADEPDQESATGDFLAALDRTLRWASESANDLPVIGPIRELMSTSQRRADVQLARSFIDDIITDRLADDTTATHTDDLLGLMLNTVDPDTGDALPHDNVRDQVITFLAAGHETTAALMSVALFYLARHPEAADAIAAELPATGDITFEAVAKARATRAFLNECLRLWPPAPGFFRIARTDQDLDGYHIPAGRGVFVLALAAQRDPAVWGANADEFDPNRFLNTRVTANSGHFFSPWGTGPRSCIGRQFALHEAALLVGAAASRFRWEPTDDRTEPAMIERATLRPEPFTLSVRPRS
ncbi:cytochrome P450 [Gordonia sp. ABSL1-1]|uniref:cytochrome P450 n=1 Tax=Gordonia sp. ABSL1-1 TaxID=3053923 RepID=UPI002572E907|nr:cytochrome P450 [Gordonia sp. ABSL1-1]MDL9937508.1 cytochrome P450 [Gordonia sp. ABSL1-1]